VRSGCAYAEEQTRSSLRDNVRMKIRAAQMPMNYQLADSGESCLDNLRVLK